MNSIWIYLWALIPLGGFLLLVCTLLVCAADARRRGKSPLFVTLLVLCSFPLGLLLWLLFRPEPVDVRDKKFRLDDYRVQ